MAKKVLQDLLDKTDIDEKIKAEVDKISDKASAELERFFSNKTKKKYTLIGIGIGFALALAIVTITGYAGVIPLGK